MCVTPHVVRAHALRMDLLDRAESLALGHRWQWVPYDRILGATKSGRSLERICVDSLAAGNGRIFWPTLVLLGYGYIDLPTYRPAGDLVYLVHAAAEVIREKEASTVTTDQAASRLGVSTRHVRRLIAEGRIKATLTDSGHWLIDGRSVEKFRKETHS